MKDVLLRILMAVLQKIVESMLTEEVIKEYEQKAKEFAYENMKELAEGTEWTDIDDALVEKIGKAWGFVE